MSKQIRTGGIGHRILLAATIILLGLPAAATALTLQDSTTAVTSATVTTDTTTLDPTTCSQCHGSDIAGRHHETIYFTQGECTYCHAGVTTGGDCSTCHTLGLQNPHHDTPAGDCAQCHANAGNLTSCAQCHAGETRETHHTAASSQAIACTSCHTTMNGVTGCTSCHGTVRQRHHDLVTSQSRSCRSCHGDIVENTDTCKNCHLFSPYNPHHDTALTDPYALGCHSCHPMNWNGYAWVRLMPTQEACVNCHTTVVGTASIAAAHHMTLPAQTEECDACHQGITPVPGCTGCHQNGSGEVVAVHHATDQYTSGNCSLCHAGAEPQGIVCANCHSSDSTLPPNHHQQPAAVAGDCQSCHTGIELNGGTCAACHTAPIPEIHHGDPLANVGGDCAACHQSVSSPTECANCHQASPHHTTAWAQNGECTHCHFVPAAVGDRPKQAACRACHGATKHDKGGPIQDFGACAACHATLPFHPKPARIPGYTGYGAGKKKFNIFWSTYAREEGPGEDIRPNGEDMDDEGGRKIKAVQLAYNTKAIVNGGKTYTVPHFDPLNAPPTLADCTRCHQDNSAKVACDNVKWTAHLTSKWVSLALYQLAETTYLGSLCSGTASQSSDNLALGKTATASKYESGYEAAKAVDGSATTRWWTRDTSNESLRINLGTIVSINKVTIDWHTYYARSYEVQTSTDGYNWSRVYSTSSGSSGLKEHTFTARNARYVRIYCLSAGSYSGFAINELGVYTP